MQYKINERVRQDIEKRFGHHPRQPGQIERYNGIREHSLALALMLARICPQSRELSLALTHLEDSVMWAIAAIARNE